MAHFYYKANRLKVVEDKYYANDQLAILVFEEVEEDGEKYDEFYGVLTVNLDDPRCDLMASPRMQYLDVNNWDNIEEILADCPWLEKTDIVKQSGFVNYPLYMFNLDKQKED